MNKKYSIEEVFELLGKENLETDKYNKSCKSATNNIKVDGYDVYTRSLRYMTFYQKGCTCCVCGRVGTHFLLDPTDGGPETRRHFNLYTDDGVLMTKDHIIPKSKGGRDHINNMQTMCTECNRAKGNTCESLDKDVDYTIIGVNIDNPEKTLMYMNEDKAIFELLNRAKVTQPVSAKIKLSAKLRKTIEVTKTFLNCLNTEVPYHNYLWYTVDKYKEAQHDNK